MKLRRWVPFVYLLPDRYVDPAAVPDDFDFRAWSREFEWRQDPWNGFRDFATPPAETIETARGDCEDYALVAVSWALAGDRDGVGLGFCFPPWSPVPRHVVAYDDVRVYSVGRVFDASPSEWLADSPYARLLRRSVGRGRGGRGR